MPTKTVAGRTWHFSHSLGHHVGPGGFTHPTAVVSAPGGIVYVADTGAAEGYQPAKIRKLDVDEGFISEFGVGDLTWPEGLALDQSGNIYCSDAHKHRVIAYDQEGEQIGEWGEPGSGAGQLNAPSGLAFDGDDNLHVVDSLNSRIQKFTGDGRPLAAWGTPGTEDGQLDRPWGITIDPEGDIYVADWGNNRVQKFSPDGAFMGRFGSQIADGGELNRPSDVAVDSEGDVYVVDWGNNRVQMYFPDGDVITGLYGDAREFSRSAQQVMDVNPDYAKAFERVDPSELIRWGRLERPRGIAIDEQDRIVITDCTRGRLQVYAKDKDYVVPQFNL